MGQLAQLSELSLKAVIYRAGCLRNASERGHEPFVLNRHQRRRSGTKVDQVAAGYLLSYTCVRLQHIEPAAVLLEEEPRVGRIAPAPSWIDDPTVVLDEVALPATAHDLRNLVK